MRTTAILNLKGGVAKTVTTVNMAAILARDYKARVLLIDADCQCNCTEFFGGSSDKGTLADILRLPDSYPDPVTFCANCIRGTTVDGVNLIPGDDSLMDLDLSKVELGRVSMNVLRQFVEAANGLYDYILIDCPPAFNAASAAALVAADDIIIPIKHGQPDAADQQHAEDQPAAEACRGAAHHVVPGRSDAGRGKDAGGCGADGVPPHPAKRQG